MKKIKTVDDMVRETAIKYPPRGVDFIFSSLPIEEFKKKHPEMVWDAERQG